MCRPPGPQIKPHFLPHNTFWHLLWKTQVWKYKVLFSTCPSESRKSLRACQDHKLKTYNLKSTILYPFGHFLWRKQQCKYESKKVSILPVHQNPAGHLEPARTINWNQNILNLLYYTLLVISCEETNNVSIEIKSLIFYLSTRILQVTWSLPGPKLGYLDFRFYYFMHF